MFFLLDFFSKPDVRCSVSDRGKKTYVFVISKCYKEPAVHDITSILPSLLGASTLYLFERRSDKSEKHVVAGNIAVSFAMNHLVSNNSCTTLLRESQMELPRYARPSSVPARPLSSFQTSTVLLLTTDGGSPKGTWCSAGTAVSSQQ